MKFKTVKPKWINVLIWLISFWALFFYQKSCAPKNTFTSNSMITCLSLVCIGVCGYLIKRLLIPEFLYKKKIGMFIALWVLHVLVFANMILLLQYAWYTLTFGSEWAVRLLFNFFYQFFECYVVVIFGSLCVIAFKLLNDQWLAQSRYAELQREKAQTELNFLKAQINPHFLFNSINSIFARIDKKNLEARHIVLKFSDMLRYQLYECNAERINFQKEFSYIRNYIELQKLRKEDNLDIALVSNGMTSDFEIAPLLLIPFIENAFKYVSNHDDKENRLEVRLAKVAGTFSFYCFNTKDNLLSRNLLEESGIGIRNVRRRLELLYPGKHELQINNTSEKFEINLKIELQ